MVMRFLIILALAICVSLVCYSFVCCKSTQTANALSLGGIHSTGKVSAEDSSCLTNLSTKLSMCEQTNKTQQQMVLIRGQVLLVEGR